MTTHHENSHTTKAIILSFPRKRGRPRITRPSVDTGTPELVLKKLMGMTTESLDLCLEREIITPEQHWCGIHLRWLYTLRHGAPGIRAIDPTHLGGLENKIDDPEWRAARENEYHDAMKKLHQARHAQLIVSICIYNERLPFLSLHTPVTPKKAQAASQMIEELRHGLNILVDEWRRIKPIR